MVICLVAESVCNSSIKVYYAWKVPMKEKVTVGSNSMYSNSMSKGSFDSKVKIPHRAKHKLCDFIVKLGMYSERANDCVPETCFCMAKR